MNDNASSEDKGDPVFKNPHAAERFRRGDRKMCGRVLSFVYPKVEALVMGSVKVGDQRLKIPFGEQEDFIAKIMVRILERRRQYKEEYAVNGWVYTITKNAIIDYHKREKTRRINLGAPVDPPPPGQPVRDLPSMVTPELASELASRNFLREALLDCAAALEDHIERALIWSVHIDRAETLKDFSERMLKERPELKLTYPACRRREQKAKTALRDCLCHMEERHPELVQKIVARLTREGLSVSYESFVAALRWARRECCEEG